MKTIKSFEISVSIPTERILSLLCCGLEDNPGWILGIEEHQNNILNKKNFLAGGYCQAFEDYWHWSQIMPVTEGCGVVVHVERGGPNGLILDAPAIERGLNVMRRFFPKHWSDFMSASEDAVTGDIFLQCCLFGHVVFES